MRSDSSAIEREKDYDMPSHEDTVTTFVIGDTVQLNSGSPQMTIHDVNGQDNIVCDWFNGENHRRETFKPQQLKAGAPLTINIHLEKQ
jgi:uncharacterized protein YodC (DUF2158 family)